MAASRNAGVASSGDRFNRMLPVTATQTVTLADTEVARIGLGMNRFTKTPERMAFVRDARPALVP
jgi:hypothetical protein